MRRLILACALSLVAHGAFAATPAANVTQLGSLLAFTYVVSDGLTKDTDIRITNANNSAVTVVCRIMDKSGTTSGLFSIGLGGRASVAFGVGAEGYYPGTGEGLMACWATNAAMNNQIKWNFLTGTAVVNVGPTAGEYPAWSFAARTAGADGSAVGSIPGRLQLDGVNYDYCPQYLLGQYSPSTTTTVATTPPKGITTFTGARFAVMPCQLDFTNPTIPSGSGGPFLTTVTLTIMNEYGLSAGSPVACIGSWYEAALPNKPSYATTNTVAFRVESKGGAAACSGLLPMGIIGSIVGTANVDGDSDRTATNLVSCGYRTGFIQWLGTS